MSGAVSDSPVGDPLERHSSTPREVKALVAAERDGSPFLAYRDGDGTLQIFALADPDAEVLIGRRHGVHLQLEWDAEASGVHAELRCLSGEWTVVDDGLSKNGTFVNGRRVMGRQRLRHGDRVRVGSTVLAFNGAAGFTTAATTVGTRHPQADDLNDTQRRVLVALCRPKLAEGEYRAPASNQQVANEVFLSVDTVKAQLRAMFSKFGLDELPQNQKRAGLADLAIRYGLVSPDDV